MNDSEDYNPELRDLVDRLLDERMGDEDMAELERLLSQYPPAQDALLESCQFHALLTFEQAAERAIDRLLAVRHQQLEGLQRIGQATLALPVGAANGGHRKFSRGKRVALLTAVAAMVMAIAVPFALNPKPLRYAAKPPKITHPQLTGLKLESGSAQLELEGIGSVTVQGPADFELIGPKRARLNYGRIKVAATEAGQSGFVVEMPNGDVTNMGPVFGIDVPKKGQNSLVVFQGAVDLRVPGSPGSIESVRVERLVEGDGVVVNESGKVERIMAIYTGQDATFTHMANGSATTSAPLIADVRDNLRPADTKRFYEIVPQGLGEDSRAYVDRLEHEWNGLEVKGMPSYLLGADYVKTFNSDKQRQTFQLRVRVSRPSRLFIFFDDRISSPDWLTSLFKDTGDDIGLDMGFSDNDYVGGSSTVVRGKGPGDQIDYRFSIWERVLETPATVTLGPNSAVRWRSGMYGIAAIELDPKNRPPRRISVVPRGNPIKVLSFDSDQAMAYFLPGHALPASVIRRG